MDIESLNLNMILTCDDLYKQWNATSYDLRYKALMDWDPSKTSEVLTPHILLLFLKFEDDYKVELSHKLKRVAKELLSNFNQRMKNGCLELKMNDCHSSWLAKHLHRVLTQYD